MVARRSIRSEHELAVALEIGAGPDIELTVLAYEEQRALGHLLGALQQLAGAVDEVRKLTGAIEHIEVLARHADTTFPDVPPRLDNLDAGLSTAAGELQKVSPDLRTLAGRIDNLDEQIKVLADAKSLYAPGDLIEVKLNTNVAEPDPNLDIDSRYVLFLETYDSVPASLLNPWQAYYEVQVGTVVPDPDNDLTLGPELQQALGIN